MTVTTIEFYPLLTGLSSMAIAQCIKMSIYLKKDGKLNIYSLFSAGGMPSSHAALVVGLTTAISIVEGIFSSQFAISAILSMVVLYDAVGIRRGVGHQARLLNKLIQENVIKGELPLKELVGHSTREVTIGSLIGLVTAVTLFNFLF